MFHTWDPNPAVCVCVCALPISSMKMIDGCSLTANVKTAAASFWDSPYHLSVKVLGCRLMKRNPASLAVAFAISVLPQPGGPYSSTPGTMMTGWRQFQAHTANKDGQHDNCLCTPTQFKTPPTNWVCFHYFNIQTVQQNPQTMGVVRFALIYWRARETHQAGVAQ